MRCVLVLLPLVLGLVGCVRKSDDIESSVETALPGNPPATTTTTAPDPAPTEAPAPAPPLFIESGDHPLFPLTPGLFRVYEGDSEGRHRRDDVTVLRARETIDGVACTAVYQEVYLDGELAEVTTEWFALDESGNLWKFGEHTFERDDAGLFVMEDDSWRVGDNGAEPWIYLGASPQIGDVFFGESGAVSDVFIVRSLSVAIVVPAGVFQLGAELVENPDDPDDTDIIIYAPSVGLVSEQSVDGRIDLMLVEQRRVEQR